MCVAIIPCSSRADCIKRRIGRHTPETRTHSQGAQTPEALALQQAALGQWKPDIASSLEKLRCAAKRLKMMQSVQGFVGALVRRGCIGPPKALGPSKTGAGAGTTTSHTSHIDSLTCCQLASEPGKLQRKLQRLQAHAIQDPTLTHFRVEGRASAQAGLFRTQYRHAASSRKV